MPRVSFLFILFLVAAAESAETEFARLRESNWHQWRGPTANGTAPHANPPTHWDEKKNVAWKVPIPGRGSSTPIVWEGRIYLLSAVETDRVNPNLPQPEDQPDRLFGIKFPNRFYKFVVICVDANSGKEIWRQVATERVPKEGHHPDNNFASASPTTDGKRLYAWFGSQGLFCYDLEGTLLWKKDYGDLPMRRSFGEGASPIVHKDRLIITRDSDGDSYILAIDARTGDTIWRKNRDEKSAWATPLVVESDGRTQVITNASKRVRSYDIDTGELIWECGGQVTNVTPSPVHRNGIVYCMSGYQGNALFAIPVSSQGDLTDSEKIAWKRSRGTPYIPSPLLYDNRLYFNQSNQAILSCVDCESGETVIDRTRMPNLPRIYASPVAAAGRVYFVARDGTTLVLEHGDSFKVLATNRLDEDIDASPALVQNKIYLRGEKSLYCIENKESP